MFNHIVDAHEDDKNPQFAMKVLRSHRSALERQIHEAVIIANSWDKGHLLNSKHEYNRCVIPRLSVMMGDQEKIDRKRTEDEKEDDRRLEEELGIKKREKRRDGQPRAKRRRRWKVEEKNQGKRSWYAQEDGDRERRSCNKRRRTETTINPITSFTVNLGDRSAHAIKMKNVEKRKCQLELGWGKKTRDAPSGRSSHQTSKTKVQSIIQMFKKIEERKNSINLPEKSLQTEKNISANSSETLYEKPANKVSAKKLQIISTKVQKSSLKTPKKCQKPLERGKVKDRRKDEKTNTVKDIRSFFEKSKGKKNSILDENVSDKHTYRGSCTAQPKRSDHQEEEPQTGLTSSTGQNLIKREGVKFATQTGLEIRARVGGGGLEEINEGIKLTNQRKPATNQPPE